MSTTNYHDAFISVAKDCPVGEAEVPPSKLGARTVANIEYDMIAAHPYRYTSDNVLFAVQAERNDVPEADRAAVRARFFAKGQTCFRSSPLTKRYGWGVHSDAEGRIALYALGSDDYRRMADDPDLTQLEAMRNKRA